MKKLFLVLICVSLLFGSGWNGLANDNDKLRTMKFWNRLNNNPNEFVEFLVPSWMPDFINDYFEEGIIIPTHYFVALSFPNRTDKDRIPSKRHKGLACWGDCKWYTLYVTQVQTIPELEAVGLMYIEKVSVGDCKWETVSRRFWLYEEDGKPTEVDEDTFEKHIYPDEYFMKKDLEKKKKNI